MGADGGIDRPATGWGEPPPLEKGGRRALADIHGLTEVGREADQLKVAVRGERVVVFRLGVHVGHHRLVEAR